MKTFNDASESNRLCNDFWLIHVYLILFFLTSVLETKPWFEQVGWFNLNQTRIRAVLEHVTQVNWVVLYCHQTWI